MNETLRWGIIGAGNVADSKSGPALARVAGSELVAVMRRDAAKAQEFAQRHGARRWYSDAESLINDSEVNAIYIASPHNLHLPHVQLVAPKHKVILCEKPTGISSAEAQTIVDVCQQHSVFLVIAYYRRFWAVTQKMLTLLKDGAIGEVIQAQVQLSDYFKEDPSRPWLTSRAASGGGALVNTGSHWVDLIRYLLGEVAEVTAFCQSSRFEIDETIGAQLRLQSGALASLNITLGSPPRIDVIDLCGTRGRLTATSLQAGELTLIRNDASPEVMHFPRNTVNHTELVTEIVAAHRAGRPSPVGGAEAVSVWRILESIYRASAEKTRITL
ncbi:MAG: Gfo/Idh/MocA family oxidoreductase [Chloroflexi bacterium]|nr:Gfo/Idh/MocA family oxidoreductase [Chloroflexota bacterium]